jgi:PHD/YefM family antitoxin component YafN of YafNO toxin-antitoxin module
MKAASMSYARKNLKTICTEIAEYQEMYVITRKKGKNVVLLTESEYRRLLESNYSGGESETK